LGIRVITFPKFGQRIEKEYPNGTTIATMVDGLSYPKNEDIRVIVEDQLFLPEEWDSCPYSDFPVILKIAPPKITGLALLATYIATAANAIAAASFVGGIGLGAGAATFTALGGGVLAGFAGAAVMTVVGGAISYGIVSLAALAMRALVKAPSTNSRSEGSLDSPTIQGARNQAFLYQRVWRVYGKHRITPPLAALPYTEIIGDDQFIRMLVTPGYGPLKLSEFKLGETNIVDFQDVQLQWNDGTGVVTQELPGPPTIIPNINLFPQDVNELSPGVIFQMNNKANDDTAEPSEWAVRTTVLETEEIGLDFVWPAGLIAFRDDGKRLPFSTEFEIEFKEVSEPAGAYTRVQGGTHNSKWILPFPEDSGFFPVGHPEEFSSKFRFAAKKDARLIRGLKFRVNSGQYDVRVRRTVSQRAGFDALGYLRSSGDQNAHSKIGDANWTVLRSSKPFEIVGDSGDFSYVALRIKASDQLSGAIDNFNFLVESLLPTYDGVSITAPVVTRNPAWAFMETLRGPVNPKPIEDFKIDFDGLKEWADFCEPSPGVYNHTFDGVFDFESTIFRALRSIGSAARADPHIRDGFYSVIIDKPRSSPIQHFTPRNSHSFAGSKKFIDLPHAFRVEFLNEDIGYEKDERIVFNENPAGGFFNAATATNYETMDIMFGVTNADRIYTNARYFQAVTKLRPEDYEITIDLEHLVCERGDWVRLTHDVPQGAVAFGRITELITDGGGNLTQIKTDERFVYIVGRVYSLATRSVDDISGDTSLITFAVNNPATTEDIETNIAVITIPILPGHLLRIGDLITFGETGTESFDAIITTLEPNEDGTAKLILQDYGPAIFDVDSEAIPAFNPHITLPKFGSPPEPFFLQINSLENGFQLIVGIKQQLVGQNPAIILQVQYRPLDFHQAWFRFPNFDAINQEILITNVIGNVQYEFRIRTIGANGAFTRWISTNSQFTGGDIPATEYGINGLELKDQGLNTNFTGRDPEFFWRIATLNQRDPFDILDSRVTTTRQDFETDIPNPLLQEYLVQIYDDSTGGLIREERVTEHAYTYTFEKNKVDAIRDGVLPRRTFGIRVAFVDILGARSPFAAIVVTNPAPEQLTAVFTARSLGITAVFAIPRDADLRGVLLWANPVSGFDPAEFEPFADTLSSPVTWLVVPPGIRIIEYFRIVAYDEFAVDPVTGVVDLSLLNMSGEALVDTAFAIIGTTDLNDVDRAVSGVGSNLVIGPTFLPIPDLNVDVATIAITIFGNEPVLIITSTRYGQNSGSARCIGEIRRDPGDVNIGPSFYFIAIGSPGEIDTNTTILTVDVPPPGVYTYKATYRNEGGNMELENTVIYVQELKR